MSEFSFTGEGGKENVSECKDFISLKSSDPVLADTSRKRKHNDVVVNEEVNPTGENGLHEVDLDEKFCRVCGDVSSGNHYGATSCDGCRGFFKRCVRYGSDYTCLNPGGSCSVDCSSRTHCQACRYQKCLAVGMFRAAVQNPRILEELSNIKDINCCSPKLRKVDSNGIQEGVEPIGCHDDISLDNNLSRVQKENQVDFPKKSFGFDITNLLGLDQTACQTGISENPKFQKSALGISISQIVKGEAENVRVSETSCTKKCDQLLQNIENNKRKHQDCDSSSLHPAKRMRSAFVACDDLDKGRMDCVKKTYDAIKSSVFFSLIPQDKINDVFTIAWRAVVLLHFANDAVDNTTILEQPNDQKSLHMRFLKLLKIKSKLINKDMITGCLNFVMGLASEMPSLAEVWQKMESGCITSQEKSALMCVLGLCLTAMDTTSGMLFPNKSSICEEKSDTNDMASTAIFGFA